MAAKTLKNSNGLQTVTFKTSQKGKKTKIRKEKSIVACSVALVMAFFLAENEKIDNWKICHRPVLAVYLR